MRKGRLKGQHRVGDNYDKMSISWVQLGSRPVEGVNGESCPVDKVYKQQENL